MVKSYIPVCCSLQVLLFWFIGPRSFCKCFATAAHPGTSNITVNSCSHHRKSDKLTVHCLSSLNQQTVNKQMVKKVKCLAKQRDSDLVLDQTRAIVQLDIGFACNRWLERMLLFMLGVNFGIYFLSSGVQKLLDAALRLKYAVGNKNSCIKNQFLSFLVPSLLCFSGVDCRREEARRQ